MIKIKPLPFFRIFTVLFLLLNLLGIINFDFYKDNMDNTKLYVLVILGLMGLFVGTFFIRTIKINFKSNKGVFKISVLKLIFYVTNIFSLILICLTHGLNGGIIIMQGSKRFITFAYTNLFIYSGIIATIIFSAYLLENYKKIPKISILYLIVQSLSVLSMGYRSPLIILLGGIFIVFLIVDNGRYNNFKNIFTPGKLFILTLIFALMSSISYYRVSQQYDPNSFFKNIDFRNLEDKVYLKPFMPTLAVFRYNQDVVTILIEKTEKSPLYGQLALSNFLTLLPGKQLGVRNKIGEIIEARKLPDGTPWSITPTLQGALFVDFGFLGVFVGFLLIGIVAEFLKKQIIFKKDPFSIAIYSLFLVNTLMLIHTGYYDLLFFLLIVLIFFFKFISNRIYFKNLFRNEN
jgi:oligosaccharide repeat unit polymerase